MLLKSASIQGRQVVAASFSEGRLYVADVERQLVIRDIQLPEPCRTAFDIVGPQGTVVCGYYYTEGIDCWDVQTGAHLHIACGRRTTRVLHEYGGVRIAAWPGIGGIGGRICRRDTGRCSGHAEIGDLLGACRASDGGLWIPGSKATSHTVFRLEMNSDVLKPTDIGGGRVWHIAASPDGEYLVVSQAMEREIICDRTRLACISVSPRNIVWEIAFEHLDAPSGIAYSGDGHLLAAAQLDRGRILILDALNGAFVGAVARQDSPVSSYGNASVLLSDGCILDLTKGELDTRLASAGWWRRAGVKG